jgi:thiol:disulfide interchange protein DsbD
MTKKTVWLVANLLSLVSVAALAQSSAAPSNAAIELLSVQTAPSFVSQVVKSPPLDSQGLITNPSSSSVQSSPEPLPPEQAFLLSANRQATGLNLQFKIENGYYLYKEKISLKALKPNSINPVTLPNGIIKYDDTFGKNVEAYRSQLNLTDIKTSAPLSSELIVDVYSQGCADIGICYPPQLQRITFAANEIVASIKTLDFVPFSSSDSKSEAIPNSTASSTSLSQAQSSAIADTLGSRNPFLLALGFIGFGLLLAFTPCVLPMVPIVSAIVLGKSSHTQSPVSTLHGLKLSSAYVLGMCVTYTIIGVLAGLAGAGLGAFLQNPILLSFFGLLMVALAGAQFGWYELSLPQSWVGKLSEEQNKIGPQRYLGIVTMGALSAIMVGPCVTAPLAGVLSYIAQTGNALLGGVALFSLALGMGIPLLLIGAGGARWLPKTGAWMNQVTYAFGIMLLGVAIWTVQSLLPAWLVTMLWVVILLLIAEMLGALRASQPSSTRINQIAKTIGLMFIVWAIAVIFGMAAGRFDVLQPLMSTVPQSSVTNKQSPQSTSTEFKIIPSEALPQALANLQGKPALLDVYADWCVSCIEFERFTFRDPQVTQLMGQFTLLKVDTTRNTAADQALMKSLKLFGPPAIVFYDSKGQETPGARVIGFQAAPAFSKHLQQVLAINSKK